MTRRFVNELAENESVDQIYRVADKQLRANRNGNLYLQLRLADAGGAVTGMLWNATDKLIGSFDAGDFCRVQGATQLYNGSIQMIVTRIERAAADQVDAAEFESRPTVDAGPLLERVGRLLESVESPELRALGRAYLADAGLIEKFCQAPAGMKNHHAYRGGLLEHVLSLMELTRAVAPRYPQVDGDLLLYGAFLHDLGKVDELTYRREFGYSDEGQLVGHLVLGVEMLNEKIREVERTLEAPFSSELALRLKHMILSHHGEYEYGSPKVPMTLEAMALHLLDNLDAKLHSFHQLMREDPSPDSRWTAYQASLGRKLYRGGPPQGNS